MAAQKISAALAKIFTIAVVGGTTSDYGSGRNTVSFMSIHTFFVSHVTEDSEPAIKLVNEIEQRGYACWIAPRDVVPGSRFDDQIADAIDDCSAFLLIFSDRCNDSDYIFRELTVAGEAHKPIIPIRIENCKPRRGLRMRLSDLHWIDEFAGREQAMEAIIRSVKVATADGGEAQSSPPRASRVAGKLRRGGNNGPVLRQAPRMAQPRPAPVTAPKPEAEAYNGKETGGSSSFFSLKDLSEEIGWIVDHDAVRELWERHRRGERNLFTRRLYTMRGQQIFDLVRKQYQRDAEFRETVDAIVSEVETHMSERTAGEGPAQRAASWAAYLASPIGLEYTMLLHVSGHHD